MLDLFRFPALSPAEQDALADKLDRFTARFAYAVIAATGAAFAFNAVRYVARAWGLA